MSSLVVLVLRFMDTNVGKNHHHGNHKQQYYKQWYEAVLVLSECFHAIMIIDVNQ
jgi:hypothetical protein